MRRASSDAGASGTKSAAPRPRPQGLVPLARAVALGEVDPKSLTSSTRRKVEHIRTSLGEALTYAVQQKAAKAQSTGPREPVSRVRSF